MIWLIGNRGMLGTELAELLAAEKLDFVGTDMDVSILDPAALAAFAAGKGIDWIVNCAAYTAVDRAEDEPELAEKLNAAGPENIGRTAKAIGARVLHISTDYVFSGDGTRPYREDDPVAPTGVYGRTKAAGEARLLAACPESVILRTAWLYGKHGKNFVYTMLRIMGEKGQARVVADQRGNPTWARDLARAVVAVLRAPEPRYGIYHFTGAGETNWYEFAREIERLGREFGILSKPAEVLPLTTAQFPSKAKRPAYSVLSKEKIQSTYGIEVPEWRMSLKAYFEDAFAFSDDIRILSGLAAYDLETAEAMLAARRYLYVAYTCEQAIEKNLKALLCLAGRPAHHHNLGRLVVETGRAISEDERAFLDSLSSYYLKSRYQTDVRILSEGIQRPEAETCLERSKALCEKLRRHPIFSIY